MEVKTAGAVPGHLKLLFGPLPLESDTFFLKAWLPWQLSQP